MIGIAQSSPRFSAAVRWYAVMNAAQILQVDAAVAVRDQLERDVVDARESSGDPGRRAAAAPGCSCGAGAAERSGSVPRPGRSCRAAIRWPGSRDDCPDGFRQLLEHLTQDIFVRVEARQQPVRPARTRHERMCGGQELAVVLQLLRAEELRPQGRLFMCRRALVRQQRQPCQQSSRRISYSDVRQVQRASLPEAWTPGAAVGPTGQAQAMLARGHPQGCQQ